MIHSRIDQHFTFNHVLKMRNKATHLKLNRLQFAVLLSVDTLSKNKAFIAIDSIYKTLLKLSCSPSKGRLHEELNYLVSIGLINKYKSPHAFHNNKYSITIAGVNELNDFELMLRRRARNHRPEKDRIKRERKKQAKAKLYETNDHVSIVQDKPIKPVSAFSGDS